MRDLGGAVATAERPSTVLDLLKLLAVREQRIDARNQLMLADEPADFIAFEKIHVETFLTAERSRREKRSPARERFGHADAARLTYDDVGCPQEKVHALGPLADAQALGMAKGEPFERLARRRVLAGHCDDARFARVLEQLARSRIHAQPEPAAEHEHDRHL